MHADNGSRADRSRPGGPRNDLSGAAGSVVQAGSVGGGISTTNVFTTGPAAPSGVPSAPPVFVNREQELAGLARLFERGAGVGVYICEGGRGVGKTALMRRCAADFRGRFTGGQLYFDYTESGARGRSDPDAAVTDFLLALGMRGDFLPATFELRVAEYRTRTRDAPVMVVIEGAEEPAQVRSLIPGGQGSAVLVSGDGPSLAELEVGPEQAMTVALSPFTPDHARELLHSLVPGLGSMAGDASSVAGLIEACEGLPLALVLVSARLRRDGMESAASLARELADEKRRLPGMGIAGGPTLAAVFGLSYHRLSTRAAELYRALGAWPGDSFSSDVCAAVLGGADTGPALEELVSVNLVIAEGRGRFAFRHPLIALDARDRARVADAPGASARRLERMLARYLVPLAFADRAVMGKRTGPVDLDTLMAGEENPFRGKPEALAWLNGERRTILGAVRAAAEAGLYSAAWRLAVLATALYMNVRYLHDWAETGMIGGDAAHMAGEPAGELRLRTTVSRPLTDLGRLEEAGRQLDSALAVAGSVGDVLLEASAHEFHGRYLDRADPAQAPAAYTRAEERAAQSDDEHNSPRAIALARYFRGCSHAAAGRTVEATSDMENALAGFLGLSEPDERMAARVKASLGALRLKEDRLQDAFPLLESAVSALSADGSSHHEAQARESLAEAFTRIGVRGESARHLRRALEIYREGGSPRARELARLLESEPENPEA